MKINIIKISLSIIGILAWTTLMGLQENRSFDEAKIKTLKDSGDFDYTQSVPQLPGFLEVIVSVLFRLIQLLLYPFSNASPTWLTVIAYIIIVSILIYAIMKSLKLDVNFLFTSSSSNRIKITEEELSSDNLQERLDQALQRQNYSLAIRYIYLLALQHLYDKNLITLQAGKTNTDYIHELQGQNVYQDFNRINYFFEYGWYGKFPITKQVFEKANAAYLHFKKQL